MGRIRECSKGGECRARRIQQMPMPACSRSFSSHVQNILQLLARMAFGNFRDRDGETGKGGDGRFHHAGREAVPVFSFFLRIWLFGCANLLILKRIYLFKGFFMS